MDLAQEPLLSFVVPIYGVKADTLKRCLRSLDDQDYPAKEIICVFDGVNPGLLKVATEFLPNKAFKIVEIDHGGAPAARNAGFHSSSGEILSFFNSDYIAKPGMARMWVDELLKHPDCGFVYGAYEYAANSRAWYPSKEFDPWLLRQSNYIDCGFPLWRRHVVEWDRQCKSLQDWDFWLRVVESGVKGHFLGREISYVAELPQKGGLSMDSDAHWIDRVAYVKGKNHIPESPLVVTSIGAPYHGAHIAKMLEADYRDDTIFKPSAYKALYMIGFYIKPSEPHNGHADILQHFENVPKIVHFVGADIYWLKGFPWAQLKTLTGALKMKVEHILCETKQAQMELADLGLPAKIVPIPPYQDYGVQPLPQKFSVAVFLTDKSDFDKYCKEETLSIVRAMPDVQFMAYGDAERDLDYPNLKHVGNLDMAAWKDFVYANSCYFRLVRHDTRPMASDEFILAGRDVITNVELPYVHPIATGGEMDLNRWDAFGPGLNAYHWPETKKKIVQVIRRVRAHPNAKDYSLSELDAAGSGGSKADIAAQHYAQVLNRQTYIRTIYELAGLRHGKELIYA